jgi:hypothetical protein
VFIYGSHSEYLNIGFSNPVSVEENMPSPEMFGYGALLLIPTAY